MNNSGSTFRIPTLFLLAGAMIVLGASQSIAQCGDPDSCNDNDCEDGYVGTTNLIDLGTGYYGTLQGGLYPNGAVDRPTGHTEAGLEFTDAIVPLDQNGDPDYVHGKIVLLSIGFSNAQQEFCFFQELVSDLEQVNPHVVVVNGAIGGWPIEDIIDEEINSLYWYGNADPPVKGVEDFLADADVTWEQVQAIWFKTANHTPTNEVFLDYIHELRNQYVEGMALLQEFFPNNRLCYLSDRTYGGYSLDSGSPEPWAYWTGWAVKRLIEKQLNGNLPYDGTNPVSPWLSWGPYLWADGIMTRSDGLDWLCRDFRENDRRHPSDCGKDKVAARLLSFFTGDETTRPWFLRTKLVNAGGVLYVTADKERFGVDNGYVGGTEGSTGNSIGGTTEDGLYQVFREGTGSIFGYDFPVPNSGSGIYHVKLHFADPASTQSGDRVFDVKCEGVVVKNDLDIFVEAGGANTAYAFEFDQDVTDEELSIKFVPVSGDEPLICAIEVDYMTSASRVTSADLDEELSPVDYHLAQNYPNPFNPETTIRYSLKNPAFVTLKIFDILGNEVASLVSGRQDAGEYSVQWSAKEQSSGVYFFKLEAGEFSKTRKLIVLK